MIKVTIKRQKPLEVIFEIFSYCLFSHKEPSYLGFYMPLFGFAFSETNPHMFKLLTFCWNEEKIEVFHCSLLNSNCSFITPHSTFTVFITNTARQDMHFTYPHHIKSVYTLGKLHIILHRGSLLGLCREDEQKMFSFWSS